MPLVGRQLRQVRFDEFEGNFREAVDRADDLLGDVPSGDSECASRLRESRIDSESSVCGATEEQACAVHSVQPPRAFRDLGFLRVRHRKTERTAVGELFDQICVSRRERKQEILGRMRLRMLPFVAAVREPSLDRPHRASRSLRRFRVSMDDRHRFGSDAGRRGVAPREKRRNRQQQYERRRRGSADDQQEVARGGLRQFRFGDLEVRSDACQRRRRGRCRSGGAYGSCGQDRLDRDRGQNSRRRRHDLRKPSDDAGRAGGSSAR